LFSGQNCLREPIIEARCALVMNVRSASRSKMRRAAGSVQPPGRGFSSIAPHSSSNLAARSSAASEPPSAGGFKKPKLRRSTGASRSSAQNVGSEMRGPSGAASTVAEDAVEAGPGSALP
jgi:hypothetical protein